MKYLFLLALTACALLAAGDVTGKWTGTLMLTGSDDGQTRPAHLVLKQEGDKLTGSAGPDANEQHPIQNGKIENGMLMFEVAAGESIMKFSLKQEGEEIKGTITREREGQTQTAKLSVKREQ